MAVKQSKLGILHAEVKEDFGGMTMQQYLHQMVGKMHRQALRTAVRTSGTKLAAEVRRQIKRRDMPYSRARNAAERRKSRAMGQVPLSRTVSARPWTVPMKGIIGIAVGPKWPEGAHGHLVEFGHRIIGHTTSRRKGISLKWLLRGRMRTKTYKTAAKVARAGERTIAHRFQEEAGERVKGDVSRIMAQAVRDFVARQERKGRQIWR